MLTTLGEKVDPRNAAIVIVDWQNDFCYRNAEEGPDGPLQKLEGVAEATTNINKLIKAARDVNMPVIFVGTLHGPDVDSEVWLERRRRRDFRPVKDSWGADWHGIAPVEGEPVVIKHRWSAFIRTELERVLEEREIKSLILAGVSSNGCVESTARDGFMLDYYIVAADDCMATSHPDGRTAAQIFSFGVVASSDEIISCWSNQALF